MNHINPDTGSKKMNKNILIVLGGAILAAVLVAFLVQMTLGGKSGGDASGDSVEVLVAAKTLRKGDEIDEGDLRWSDWPEGTLFKGAILRKDGEDADEALEGRVERAFSEGEPLKRSDLIPEEGNFVAARLKAGERAVSVKLDAEDMVAGFLAPGSYVDVILTYTERVDFGGDNRNDFSPQAVKLREMIELNVDKLATETILENVRVLALDQSADRNRDDKVKVGKTVTLAASIRDVEKLAMASELGRITLAMRGVGDDEIVGNNKILSDARLTSIDDEIHREAMRIKNVLPPSSDDLDADVPVSSFSYSPPAKVRIYSGASVQILDVD